MVPALVSIYFAGGSDRSEVAEAALSRIMSKFYTYSEAFGRLTSGQTIQTSVDQQTRGDNQGTARSVPLLCKCLVLQ
jgi:hypothetical protein